MRKTKPQAGHLTGMATYLEEFLESIQTLPAEIKRNLDLMRELDGAFNKMKSHLATMHESYLKQAKKRHQNNALHDPVQMVEASKALEEIRKIERSCSDKAQEKVAIAMQTYDAVDRHINRLDNKLRQFEGELRSQGEFKDDTGSGAMKVDKKKPSGKNTKLVYFVTKEDGTRPVHLGSGGS